MTKTSESNLDSTTIAQSPKTAHTTPARLRFRQVPATHVRKPRRRVPVVLQMNSVECAAACLAMILGYFGRKTRLEECRAKCDAGRDGVTAQTIVTVAREYGLCTHAAYLNSAEIKHLSTPAIVHWNFNHFVVLERYSAGSVEIVDPGWGRREIGLAEFAASFSGVALTFEPRAGFEKRAKAGANLSVGYLKRILSIPGAGRLLRQILAASLVLQVFGFVLPLVTKVVVDHVIPARAVSALDLLGIGALLIAVAHASMSYFRSALLISLEERLDSNLMLEFFKHLLSLPFRFFQQRNSGDLLMRLGSNATIREALASYTTSALLDGTLVLIYLAVLLRIAPLFGFVSVAIALVEVGVLIASSRRLHSLVENDLACQSESQSCLIESLMGISTLKAAGVEDRALARWSGLLAKQLKASVQRSRFAAKTDSAITVIRTFSPLCLLWLGGVEVLHGWMSLGTMLAVSALATVFLLPVSSLVTSAQRLQLAQAHVERIADVMQAEPEQKLDRVKRAPSLSGRIELRNVSFRYDNHAKAALHDISLTILPGQKVALVGRTGSGKSTLAKLLLGLYLPSEGELLYDSLPLQSLNLQTVRSQWGAVLQESFLFSSSIHDNISFHDPGISSEDVVTAARIAMIHTDITHMPMGYETRIDEGGNSLSGGQRQRLAIARAIVRKPTLLLLDEATSHLDALTETMVDRNLDTLPCTRVVVAHRLCTVQNADLIVVLDEGAIVEQGSHDGLLTRSGHYAALVHNQLEQVAPENI
jgi:ATP-binding cassette subfamily B protein